VASSGEIANASGAERFIGALHRHGVRFMFGQSIPSRFYLVTDDFGIKQIAYRTENAGAVMADAYSRVSGRVAVVTGQNGPAATLLVAGLAEALNASIPMVAMVQEVPRIDADRNAFQELDQLELFKGSCKWLKRVDDITRIDDYVDMAFTAAASGRPGPAVLLCPKDMIDLSSVPRSDRVGSLGEYPLDRPVAETARIEEAAALLAGAERPLIYAGGGVHLSGATAELAHLQETAHLPVATTTMGKGGVDEGHGLSLGVIGYYMGTNSATKFMRPLVETADVILLIGNRTNQNGTDSWTLLPKGARYIHIDIDGQEIGRNYEAMRLQGDAKATLEALTEALGRHDLSKRAAARPQVAAAIADAKAKHIKEVAPLATSTAQPIRPERMMADVATILTPEHIVVADASYASIWICNNLRSLAPGMRFLTPRGMAGLGWGLPMALGAKLARPEAPIYCLVGDGGFAHVWSELETARRHNLNVVVSVLSNSHLGFQKHAEEVRYGAHTDAVDIDPIDHAAIARACGLYGERIERPEDYLPALEAAFTADRTTVLDVIVDPDAYPPITGFESRGER
jgi:acetolactate synthase-1/2/3 large subunit